MKRIIAILLAVTLFFSFSVPALAVEDVPVGVSDVPVMASAPVLMSAGSPAVMSIDPDTPSVNGSWLDGSFSFLDGNASANNGSTSTFFSNLRSFTVPANNGKTINFIVQQFSLILRGNSPYLISFDAIVPAEPVSVSLVLTGSDGSGWVTVPVSDYSYSGGRLCVNSVFMPPKAGYFRHLALSYSDNFSSSFDVSVSSFSVTNLSTMSFDGNSSAAFANRFTVGYIGGTSSSPSMVSSTVDIGKMVLVPDFPGSTGNRGYVRPLFSSSLLSGKYYYCATFLAHTSGDNYVSVQAVSSGSVTASSPFGTLLDCSVVDSGEYIQVSGVFDNSCPDFWFSSDHSPASLGLASFYAVPIDSISAVDVSDDKSLAAYIGSFFSNMYNSLIGFFVSQDDDAEKDFDDSYNPAVDQGISEAQSNITAAEEFEQGIFGQADSAMSQINPGGVQTPSTLINSMAFISGLWTDSYNQLPSDFQFVITFPLFLGIALMFIGRSGRVWGGMMSTRSKPLGNYVNGQRVTVIDAKYFH